MLMKDNSMPNESREQGLFVAFILSFSSAPTDRRFHVDATRALTQLVLESWKGPQGRCNNGLAGRSSSPMTIFILSFSSAPAEANDAEDSRRSLFNILESGICTVPQSPRITDLTTEYLEKQLGSSLGFQNPPNASTTLPPPPPAAAAAVATPPLLSSEVAAHSHATSDEVLRLQERLRLLEAEVESSADQLRASNCEFIDLRERLTSATVEKAHLKATVDGLDDQVSG